jgi:glutaredoxin
MNKKLIIFTLNGCSFCNIIKKRLSNESISFTEYEINHYPELWDQVVSQTNSEYLPTFFIREGDDESGKVFCPKKDFNDEDTIMEILRKFLL